MEASWPLCDSTKIKFYHKAILREWERLNLGLFHDILLEFKHKQLVLKNKEEARIWKGNLMLFKTSVSSNTIQLMYKLKF